MNFDTSKVQEEKNIVEMCNLYYSRIEDISGPLKYVYELQPLLDDRIELFNAVENYDLDLIDLLIDYDNQIQEILRDTFIEELENIDPYLDVIFSYNDTFHHMIDISLHLIKIETKNISIYLEKVIDRFLDKDYSSKMEYPFFYDDDMIPTYEYSLKDIYDHFRENRDNAVVDKLYVLNNSTELFDYDEIKIWTSIYHWQQKDIKKSIKLSKDAVINTHWVGHWQFRTLIMSLHDSHGRDGGGEILDLSYDCILDQIKKAEPWEVLSLLNDMLNTYEGEKVYRINREDLLNDAIAEVLKILLDSAMLDRNNAKHGTKIITNILQMLIVLCGNKPSFIAFNPYATKLKGYLKEYDQSSIIFRNSVRSFEGLDVVSVLQTEDIQKIISNILKFLRRVEKMVSDELRFIEKMLVYISHYNNWIDSFDDSLEHEHLEATFFSGKIHKRPQDYDSIMRALHQHHPLISQGLINDFRDEISEMEAMWDDVHGRWTNLPNVDYEYAKKAIESGKVPNKEFKATLDEKIARYADVKDLLIKIRTPFLERYNGCKNSLQDLKAEIGPFEIPTVGHVLIEICMDLILLYNHRLEKEKREERNKILGSISHKIKNQIHSIKNPIYNLLETAKDETELLSAHKQTLKNISANAEHISNLSNFASLSLSSSISDFEFDTVHDSNGKTLDSILVESMKDAIPNMFETRLYITQSRNYFPDRESFIKANDTFNANVAGTESMKVIIDYLNEYLLTAEIDISNLSMLKLGNDKSTPTRLRFIFSELMLNCLKNASFIPRSERKLNIKSVFDDETIEFLFSNTHHKQSGISKKTSGHGVHLIQETIRAYNGQMIITADDGKYDTKVTLPNLWHRLKKK